MFVAIQTQLRIMLSLLYEKLVEKRKIQTGEEINIVSL